MTHMPNIYHYSGEIEGNCWWSVSLYLEMAFMFVLKSWDRSVSIVAMLWAGRSRARFLTVTVIFIFFRMSTLVLGPTQPPIQEILGLFPQSWHMKLTTHICLLPKIRMCRSVRLLLYMSLWQGQRQLYL